MADNSLPKLEELTALTPLDGRYRGKIAPLAKYCSEQGLIELRIEVEIRYLIALAQAEVVRKLNSDEEKSLTSLYQNLSSGQIEEVKKIEQETRHDMKAVERFLRNQFEKLSLSDLTEMIHFGLTSADINNLAYSLMLKRATEDVVLPKIEQVVDALSEMAKANKDLAMLARTHGQPAVPTTLGKEMAVFVARLDKQVEQLSEVELTGKINGAVGNYNALAATYPEIDWVKFSEDFVGSLGLTANILTTQINNFDDVAIVFQTIERINNILVGLNRDIWRYISDGWFIQENVKGEVGSSTMPQKVNPIDFENSEGNLGMANALLEHMARKLPVSRLQRDLTDSTVTRNYGAALGYCLVAYESLLTGLGRIKPNVEQITKDLNEDWSILTEAIQTILRKNNVSDSYSLVKNLVRGKKLSEEDYKKFVIELNIDTEIKAELSRLTPSSYIGLASKLTEKLR